MKLIINTILAFSSMVSLQAKARDIVLIENLSDATQGQVLISILTKKYHLPQAFLTYKERQECSQSSEAVLQICILKNGELEVVKEKKRCFRKIESCIWRRRNQK